MISLKVRTLHHFGKMSWAHKYNYTSSFDLISKYDDCKIDCLYRFKSIDKKEVLRKEKEYIEMYKDIIVNKYSPIKC